MLRRSDEIGVLGAKRGALIIGLSYLVLASLYIVFSGKIAHALAADMAELARLEQLKGLLFIGMTSVYLGLLSYWLLRQLWRQGQSLARQREALLRAEHRATSGVLASSLAHDFNNVLVSLSLGIDELAHTDDQAALLGDLKQAVAHGRDMTAQLLARMRERGISEVLVAPVELGALAAEAVELARPLARQRRVRISVEISDALMIRGDANALRRALANLLVNAVDAVGVDGRVSLVARPLDVGAIIEVHDDGPGFTPDALARLTEPFYTTKVAGTGLGLFSARVCAEQHHGRLELDRSELLGGACARIVIGAV